MQMIDLHCDTILCLMESGEHTTLRRNSLCVDIDKLQAGQALAQFFALYINKAKHTDPFEYCLLMLDRFYQELAQNTDTLQLVCSYSDLCNAMTQKKIAAFLTIEEGGVLKGKIEYLRIMHRLGVRLITLTWNYPNEIGFPNCEEIYRHRGLTAFGQEVVHEMNRLGMIIDVSHLSDQGFYDVASLSAKPFTASHSNARSITNHPRNLTDTMIKTLANKGGIMGLNFANLFLGASPTTIQKTDMSQITDMVRHLNHIRNVGGTEVLAMGTDFDGIECPVEIENIGQVGKLADALQKAHWSSEDIEKLFYKNALRFIQDVLP